MWKYSQGSWDGRAWNKHYGPQDLSKPLTMVDLFLKSYQFSFKISIVNIPCYTCFSFKNQEYNKSCICREKNNPVLTIVMLETAVKSQKKPKEAAADLIGFPKFIIKTEYKAVINCKARNNAIVLIIKV